MAFRANAPIIAIGSATINVRELKETIRNNNNTIVEKVKNL